MVRSEQIAGLAPEDFSQFDKVSNLGDCYSVFPQGYCGSVNTDLGGKLLLAHASRFPALLDFFAHWHTPFLQIK
jgi:hypothetical protein